MRLIDRRLLTGLMAKRGVSVRDLAANCGLAGHGMIQQLRSGHRTTCTPGLAALIARSLSVPIDYLFEPRVSIPAIRPVKREKVSA